MIFRNAFALYGPDVERISSETGIAPHEVDCLINAAMNAAYLERLNWPVRAVTSPAPARQISEKLIRYAGYDERGSA
ncbi:hypothetical protein ASF70_15900 [Rhizobium sp. Leaf321]|uniref:hypothetical protein n=1 Tax=Rhizobium sp. Leaf321 TaxID=1736335 RepID=UPI000714A684|nr:hypothetical protein [Rhizobium sp. Leaf321]KQQ72949.1 hypothetical protein ASF70_15900 [Rhizobium sp. Leaf321]